MRPELPILKTWIRQALQEDSVCVSNAVLFGSCLEREVYVDVDLLILIDTDELVEIKSATMALRDIQHRFFTAFETYLHLSIFSRREMRAYELFIERAGPVQAVE
jgi:predicted nucleotidyltransferase